MGDSDVVADGIRIAKEIVLINVSEDFGVLRNEMTNSLLIREFFRNPDPVDAVATAISAMSMLAVTIEEFANAKREGR